jgi:sugar-specific transcriptional regulator TrmB
MPDGSDRATLFKDLRELLHVPPPLTRDEAAVYALALQKGVISSPEVTDYLGTKPPRASELLSQLVRKKFLEAEVREEGGKVRKNKAVRYRPVHTKIALKDYLARFDQLKLALEHIDEHLTTLAEQEDIDESFWKVPPEATPAHLCSRINAAGSSINILCNDCTWAQMDGVLDALAEARQRGVAVTVLAFGVHETVAKRVQARGIRLLRAPFKNVPMAIIDEKSVYLHHPIATQSGCLHTSNPRTVQTHVEHFNGRLGECVSHDGKVARAPPTRQGDERQPEGQTAASEVDLPP